MRKFIVLVLTLALLGPASLASAARTETAVSGTQQAIGFEPGETWMSGPIQHVRGGTAISITSPTIGLSAEGVNTVSFSYNLDTRTGEGRTWGTGNLAFADGGFETTFTGDVVPGPFGPEGLFRVVGHGYGAYEGMQLRLTGHELLLTGFTTFEGILFQPGSD